MNNNYGEIIERITAKLMNAQTWYENAVESHRFFAEFDQERGTDRSSSYLIDRERIGKYISELQEVLHLFSLDNQMDVTIFDEETSEIFDNTCKLHKEGIYGNYTYIRIFKFGQNQRVAYIYIPPIRTICKGEYGDKVPPSKDSGD